MYKLDLLCVFLFFVIMIADTGRIRCEGLNYSQSPSYEGHPPGSAHIVREESINLAVCFSQEAEGSLPYLLVLCGDHGMSETGSHGGSSEPEVNTPLVLISPVFKRKGKLIT